MQREVGIKATGNFDKRTEAAVRVFQRKKGLQVDGKVGRQTVAAMRGKKANVGALGRKDRAFLRPGKPKAKDTSVSSATGRSTDFAAGAATQTPIIRGVAKEISPRIFYKQIGRVGTVPTPDGPYEFTREKLETYVRNFKERAFDQVPLTLTDHANQHSDDPRLFQGDLVGMETDGEKLYAPSSERFIAAVKLLAIRLHADESP